MKLIIIFTVQLASLAAYITNLYKFSQCDFKESYKEEAIYGIGIFTPTFVVTAWIDIK